MWDIVLSGSSLIYSRIVLFVAFVISVFFHPFISLIHSAKSAFITELHLTKKEV